MTAVRKAPTLSAVARKFLWEALVAANGRPMDAQALLLASNADSGLFYALMKDMVAEGIVTREGTGTAGVTYRLAGVPVPPPDPRGAKVRRCLGCSRDFHSEGIHNRLCATCGGRGIADGDYGLVLSSGGKRGAA